MHLGEGRPKVPWWRRWSRSCGLRVELRPLPSVCNLRGSSFAFWVFWLIVSGRLSARSPWMSMLWPIEPPYLYLLSYHSHFLPDLPKYSTSTYNLLRRLVEFFTRKWAAIEVFGCSKFCCCWFRRPSANCSPTCTGIHPTQCKLIFLWISTFCLALNSELDTLSSFVFSLFWQF